MSTSSNNNLHVSFNNVYKTYDGDNLIVNNLNLDINKGDFVTMLGPSGSGKTTCLMMLAGFETVTRGDILVNGESVKNIPPSKRNFGLVFQNYALFPHMTVKENLAFPLEVRKYSKKEIIVQVKKALNMVQLQDFSSRRISQLSGGQKQRIAVARALVFEPNLILMDEPLGALDKNLREEMQYEIKHLHASLNKTFIYVTHDQTEALTMSDKVAVFESGIVQQYSSPKKLYEEPNNLFVSKFLGENNFFTGTLKTTTDNLCEVQVTKEQILKALPIDIKGTPDKAIIAIRPEKLNIDRQEDLTGYNQVEAQIQEIIYLGDHIRLRLNSLNNDQLISKVSNSDNIHNYNIDDKVTLSWRYEHGRAFS